jgi:hypothetical protein
MLLLLLRQQEHDCPEDPFATALETLLVLIPDSRRAPETETGK